VSAEVSTLFEQIRDESRAKGDLSQLLARFETLLATGVPLCPEMLHKASKLLKLEKWKLRLEKMKQSKHVTLKQIESLIKEAKSHAVQDDPECRKQAQEVEDQLVLCRVWLSKFEEIQDFNDLQVVGDLLDLASTGKLGFVMQEFTLLKEDHY